MDGQTHRRAVLAQAEFYEFRRCQVCTSIKLPVEKQVASLNLQSPRSGPERCCRDNKINPMLCMSASGPEIELPGRISAGCSSRKHQKRPSGLPKAGRFGYPVPQLKSSDLGTSAAWSQVAPHQKIIKPTQTPTPMQSQVGSTNLAE